MPNPFWFELPFIVSDPGDGRVGPVHTMVMRHENLEHTRAVVENAQKAFDASVAYASRQWSKKQLAEVLGLSEAAVAKIIGRGEKG